MIYLCLLIGVLIFSLLRLEEATGKHRKNSSFSWSVFFVRNIVPSLIAILSGIIIILNKEAAEYWICKLFPAFKVDGVIMGFYGIVGDVFLKKTIELFKRRLKGTKDAERN